MKRIFFLSISMLCIASLLVGCSKNISSQQTDSSISSTQTTQEKEKSALKQLNGGNLLLNGLVTNDRYYSIMQREDGTGNIFVLDDETKEEKILCTKENCEHIDESCNSFLQNASSANLYAVDDYLLLLENSFSQKENTQNNVAVSKLDKISLDGSTKSVMYTFKENETIMGDTFATDEQNFYFTLRKTNDSDTSNDCVQLNIQDASLKTVFSLQENENIISVSNNAFILYVSTPLDPLYDTMSTTPSAKFSNINSLTYKQDATQSFTEDAAGDDGEPYVYNATPSTLTRVSLDNTENRETIKEFDYSTYLWTEYNQDTCYYLEVDEDGNNTDDIRCIHLSTGEDTSFIENFGGNGIGLYTIDNYKGDYLFITKVDVSSNQSQEQSWVIDTASKQKTQITMPLMQNTYQTSEALIKNEEPQEYPTSSQNNTELTVPILAVYEDYFLVEPYQDVLDFSQGYGDALNNSNALSHYAFISKENYLANNTVFDFCNINNRQTLFNVYIDSIDNAS